MAWDPAAILPGDMPFGTRRMRMAAAPIPRRAEERAGFTASRRNKPVRTGALTKLLVEKGVITERLQGNGDGTVGTVAGTLGNPS